MRLSISMACSSPTKETTPKLSGWPASFFVFALLDRRRDQRGDRQSLLPVDLAVAAGTRDAVSDGVRLQARGSRYATA
jgi:hypothetical protein